MVYILTIYRLTNEQRLLIIEFYYQNECSVKKVHSALLRFYGQFNQYTETDIRAIVTKFRTKLTLLDIRPRYRTRLRRVRTEENIAAVLASINDDHQLSIRFLPLAAIEPLLLNNVENFVEGFRCVSFKNTAKFLVNGLLEC